MSAKSEVTYSLIQGNDKAHSFVKGNTKFLKDMSQQELAILHRNGDTRIKTEENSSDDKKPVRAAAPTPAV